MRLAAAPVMAPLPVYNPDEPPHLQEHDWDCAQESLEWMLWAYSRTPDDSWMELSLQAGGYVNPALGCTDASGAGLVRWLNEQYSEYGYLASNSTGLTFDQVVDEAGTHAHPLAMNGAAWYHWSGVASYDPLLDRLELRNPAPGWQGVYQTLDRDQWARLGPWSLVRLTHPEAEGGGVAPSTLPYGPDVSSHQGHVDWAAVAGAGCSLGFTKATGGAWYRNPTLAANWQGLAAAGLQRGAYHFAFESSGQPLPGPGPEAEAAYFLDAVLPLGLGAGDMLVLDIEQGAGPLGDWALRWLRHVEEAVGFRPLLYTGAWFSGPHGFADVPELADYGLWLADYAATSMPAPVAPWGHVAFWQFTSAAAVPGISTPADGNRFNGTAEQLGAWGKPGAAGPLPPDEAYVVGPGILAAMDGHGDVPGSSEVFTKRGTTDEWSEALAASGARYLYLPSCGRVFRYAPA